MTKFASSETDSVGENWRNANETERISRLEAAIRKTHFKGSVKFTRAQESGAIYLSLEQPLRPSVRGSFLLDLELFLKQHVDRGIAVWCEPLGDRNSLRKLRGVKVLS